MRKYIVSLLVWGALIAVCPAFAQADGESAGRRTTAARASMRTEFVSYDMREQAEKGDRAANQYYRELAFAVDEDRAVVLERGSTPYGDTYTAELDVPVLWLDRELFLHTEGFRNSDIFINGRKVSGTGGDMLPCEVDITPYITDGINRVVLRQIMSGDGVESGLPVYGQLAYVYSQPKLRIEDFQITAEPDSLNKYGILTVRIALANGYNFPEEINVGYDIYDPKGKLQYFDNRDIVVPGVFGGGRDTLEFREFIYGTPANLWSADKPLLYHGMLIVKHGRRVTEYIPYRVGFGKTEVVDGRLVRNGKAVEVKAVRYNAAADRKTTADELSRLKKEGFNTIMVDYTQPYWFYDLTDQTGLYVFDQPGIDYSGRFTKERTPGGTPANDPANLERYIYLSGQMFSRSRNHTSIAGWSLGGDHGNGYNLYKTYQWLKENEPTRPVIYNGAEGEWNSDMEPLKAADAREVLTKPAAPAQSPRRR